MNEQKTDFSVELFRCTVFGDFSDKMISEAWKKITGEEPEKANSNLKRKRYIYEGPFSKGKVTTAFNPGRFDLLYSATSELESETIFDVLGKYQLIQKEFQEFSKKLFSMSLFSKISRIAYGVIALIPVDSLDEGYSILSPLLPHIIFSESKFSDFLYQINRSRKYKSNKCDLDINRLSKWSVASTSMIEVALGRESQEVKNFGHDYAVRVELDINTIGENIIKCAIKEGGTIFLKLMDLGQEILERGDVE